MWGVAISTGLAALAFLSIYTRPHTVVTASEWLYRNVPPGKVIATQHWDEGFPLPLPGQNPGKYKVDDLPYYEPDTPGKWRDIANRLAAADYIAFQTKRLYGSLTMAPEQVSDRQQLLLSAVRRRSRLHADLRPRLAAGAVRPRGSRRARRRVDHRLRPSQGPDLREHRPSLGRRAVREDHARPAVEEAHAATTCCWRGPTPSAAPASRRARSAPASRRCCGSRWWSSCSASPASHPAPGAPRPRRLWRWQGARRAAVRLRAVAAVSFGQAAFTRGTLSVTFGLLLLWGALAWRRGARRRAERRVGAHRAAVLGHLPALPAGARLQPGDLLGREADGLLVPQRAVARHHAAAAGAVVLRLDAALHLLRPLHRRRARQALQHPSGADLQPRHRAVRRPHRERRVRPRGGGRRPAQRRPPVRDLRRPDRQPRRPARAAVPPRGQLRLLLGDLAGHQGHHQRVSRSGASCSPTCTRT